MYYSRSVAPSDNAYFDHTLGFAGQLDFNATKSLILSSYIRVYRELGDEHERFLPSNWQFSATRIIPLPLVGVLHPSFYFVLPTNPDDRRQDSYRGALGFDLELRKHSFYNFHKDHAFGGSVGTSASRAFYKYTTDENLGQNPAWYASGYFSANYKYRDWVKLIFTFRNYWRWDTQGSRENDLYSMATALHVRPVRNIWLSLTLLNRDRTFLYDRVSSNWAVVAPQATNLVFGLTYLPRLSKTHELNR